MSEGAGSQMIIGHSEPVVFELVASCPLRIGKGSQGVSRMNTERKSEEEVPRVEGIFRDEYPHVALLSDLSWVIWWELVGG